MSLFNPMTGRKVFAITAGAFGVVIGANVVLAVQALSTFPGLEVANSYVASQTFEADRAAQEALGWTARVRYDGRVLEIAFTGPGGAPAVVADLVATVGRPTHVREDVTPAFEYTAGTFRAPVALAPGIWQVRLEARAPDGTPFRQRHEFTVRGGGA